MRSARTRMNKNFDLAVQLERYGEAIEREPRLYAGRWASACYPLPESAHGGAYSEVRIDLGCGKGTFTVEMARRSPDVLFIGIETEPLCIAYGARKALEQGVRNAVFVPSRDDAMEFFGPGELSAIYLNFSTPFARKRDSRRRLTYFDRLMAYRELLAPGGIVRLKTDSFPLRDYTLTQFEEAGYQLLWVSDDVRCDYPDDPQTEYEERLVAEGALVYGCAATPGPAPADATRPESADRSLTDFLPDDPFALDYVPLGMERYVQNMRNVARKRNQAPESA